MQKLQVGKPFPLDLQIRDGLAVQPMPDGLMALVHLSRFQPGDKSALGGPLTVAVLQAEEDVPWVALRYHKNGLCLDGPILVSHRADLRENLANAGNALQLVALKGGRYTVKGLRLLGLSDEVMAAIKTATAQEYDRADLQRLARRVQRQYRTSDEIYEAATLTQTFE